MTELIAKSLRVQLGGRVILPDISLTIGSGINMLLGRNGSGKSTLLRALLGFVPLTRGDIRLNGENLLKLSVRERAKRLAYLPQHQTAMLQCPLIDYVALGVSPDIGLFSSPDTNAYARAEHFIDLFALSPLRERTMDTLSGGEARLAALARLKMHTSEFYLMDEPLAGLDYRNQHEFLDLVKNDGMPVLMSIHDPALAWQYADRILVMDGGGLIASGTPDDPLLDEALVRIYGKSLRFQTLDGRRFPYWHSDGKDEKHDV